MTSSARQIYVRFTTRSPEIRITETPISVPLHLARYGLSEVVNHLLGWETHQPFDFVVADELLRCTLEEFLAARPHISTEATLNVEYMLVLPKPLPPDDIPHDDWVSSVCCSGSSFATGCYDGHVRVFCMAGPDRAHAALLSSSGTPHSAPVRATAWIEREHDAPSPSLLLSASKDMTVRLWRVPSAPPSSSSSSSSARSSSRSDSTRPPTAPSSSSSSSTSTSAAVSPLQPVATFVRHSDSVEALSVAPSGNQFVSGGWDCSIFVWNVDSPAQPIGEIKGHTQCVTGLSWVVRSALYSVSRDQTLRYWDVESGLNSAVWHSPKPFNALAFSRDHGLIATAHSDRIVRLWDSRSADGSLVKLNLTSHSLWVSSVAWNPANGHQLVSVSYDNSVKLWDIRTTLPLYTLTPHDDRALCVDWLTGNNSQMILSGGQDSKLKIHTLKSPAPSAAEGS